MLFEDYVPARKIEQLEKKIKSLNKRAVKMAMPPISLKIDQEKFEIREVIAEDYENRRKFKIKYVWVEIDGESPQYPGWQLKGVIEHTRDVEYNKVLSVPNLTGASPQLSPSYRTIKPTCDHCNTQRFRNKTFVLYKNDGQEIRVGSSCIKDFLGHEDPETILNHAKFLSFLEFGEFREHGIGIGYVPEEFEIVDVLARTAMHIREHGWTSKAKAMDWDTIPTSASVQHDYDLIATGKGWKVDSPTEGDVKRAKDALAWINEFDLKDPNLNEYLYNCGLIARGGMVRYREFGLACSIVASYDNHLAKIVGQNREKKNSEWVGEVGQKGFEVDVEFVQEWGFSGQWGTTYIMKFADADGNIFIWKTSVAVTLKAGDKVHLRGTIKAHDTKYDVKQTVLTRCKYKIEVDCNECGTKFLDDHKDLYSFCSDDCRQKYADKLEAK